MQVAHEDDGVSVCPFCGCQSHTDVVDCPNIDPEQLAIELFARNLHAIADAITAKGWPAYVEHPGYVAVNVNVGARYELIVNAGTANGDWGYDVCYPNAETTSGELNVSRDAAPAVVVAALEIVINRAIAQSTPRPVEHRCTNNARCAARGCADCQRSYGPRH